MTRTNDPVQLLDRAPMSWLQILAVAITIGLCALDGFDVLAISFAAPGIVQEWGIDRAALGVVLSMELLGMAIGSILLGGVADRYGRRPTILGCLIVMTIGMYLASTSQGIGELSLWRVLTGLGIGGMLAAIGAVAAEFANARRRNLSVALMAVGYPVGAVLGGTVAARLLASHDWRSVFHFGSAMTALFIPMVLALMPESVHWLTRKQPAGALARVQRIMARSGHAPVLALPAVAVQRRRPFASELFSRSLWLVTLLVTLAYFFHITTFYFILKWVPKIVVDMGFAASAAASKGVSPLLLEELAALGNASLHEVQPARYVPALI